MKGLIALDIDGTVVVEMNPIAQEVQEYLQSLVEQGWVLVFITGRTFHFAEHVLSCLPFPYFIAAQNGAVITQMPKKCVVSKKYLSNEILSSMDEICRESATDFVVYSGFETGDQCYYRPSHFSSDLLMYLKERSLAFKEVWLEKKSFDDFFLREFPCVKCFGIEKEAFFIAREIDSRLGLHVPVIKDPFREGYYVVLATHPKVSKGYALEDMIRLMNFQGAVIAAGDDNNDRSMLEKASIKVVMSTAPLDMQRSASIIAPPASQNGIIEGLDRAIALFERHIL